MKTIAIIDDDSTFLYLLQSLLKKEGYRVVVYGDSVNFLTNYKENMIDLIITDINMPLKSGTELISDLSKKFDMKQVPIIFLTGQEDAININNAFENNIIFIHYLLKPLNFTLLLMTVNKMFLLKEQYITIKDANEGLLSVIKQLREQQITTEHIIDNQRIIYESEHERLYSYLKELRMLVQK